jgi:dTDP-4-amino-4,6-dideoxygalactose transaminase
MNVPFLDLKPSYQKLRGEIDRVVADVFDKCNFILGEPVAAFEKAFAEYCGAPHALACASGTDALKISLQALGVGPGDEVITSPLTFVATAESIHYLGARPVFCDVDPASCNLSPAAVRAFIENECETVDGKLLRKSTGGRVAGILPVHLYGQCADMDALNDMARAHNLFVLEDAAQAAGATFGGARAGALGTAAAFSFYPSKNLGGAGDGGLITTADDDLATLIRVLRVHGAPKPYLYTERGFNSRLDTLQAVVLAVKLPHLEEWIQIRRQKATAYIDMFRAAASKKGVTVLRADEIGGADLPAELHNRMHTFNSFNIRTHGRDGLAAFLKDSGIGSNIYYPIPLHVQSVYAHLGYKDGDFPAAEAICRGIMAVPMFPEITEEQQAFVVEKVVEFVGK